MYKWQKVFLIIFIFNRDIGQHFLFLKQTKQNSFGREGRSAFPVRKVKYFVITWYGLCPKACTFFSAWWNMYFGTSWIHLPLCIRLLMSLHSSAGREVIFVQPGEWCLTQNSNIEGKRPFSLWILPSLFLHIWLSRLFNTSVPMWAAKGVVGTFCVN